MRRALGGRIFVDVAAGVIYISAASRYEEVTVMRLIQRHPAPSLARRT
jgi:hypothetical protein